MNSFFFIFIGIPVLEIFLLIKIGGKIGGLNTIALICLTAMIGIYFAKLQGIKTVRTGVMNVYQNKTPIYEIISGATILVAAFLLIVPGFLTDTFGFLLLIPATRKILVNLFVKEKKMKSFENDRNTLDGEIVEDKKDEL